MFLKSLTMLLVIAVVSPTPFVSGSFYICGVSGHVYEGCPCSERDEAPTLARGSCCEVHAVPDDAAFLRGEKLPGATQNVAGLLCLPTPPHWHVSNLRHGSSLQEDRAPPPLQGRSIRILHCSFLA